MKFYLAPFTFITTVFVVGLLLSKWIPFHLDYVFISFVTLFILLYVIRKLPKIIFLPAMVISFLIFGAIVMNNFSNQSNGSLTNHSSVVLEIVEAESSKNSWKKCIGVVRGIKSDKSVKTASEKVLLFSVDQMFPGDKILFHGDFEQIQNTGNPGEFDAKQYWNNKNIYKMSFIGTDDYKLLNHNSLGVLAGFFLNIRGHLASIIDGSFDGDKSGIIKALLLGDKSDLSIETRKSFSDAGAMHVLAVSGLHVGIIMYVLLFVFGKFSRFISKKWAVVLCILFVWFYAGITGFSPSVMRAAFMFSVVMIGQQFGRKTSGINSLFFSAFILLLLNPLLIYDIGFQLSYLALLGILLFYESIAKLFSIKNKWLRKAWEGTSIGVAAQVLTAPLMLYQFHQFPNYFLLTNIGIMLFAGVLLILGLLLFVFSGIALLKGVMVVLLGTGVTAMLFFVQFIESIPGSVSKGFAPSFILFVAMYMVITALYFFYANRRIRTSLIGFGILLLVAMQMDRFQNITSNEIVIYNNSFPIISIKTGNNIVCLHRGDKEDDKKLKFVMESYARVKPGDIEYVELIKGENSIKYSSSQLNLVVRENTISFQLKGKHHVLRTKYGASVEKADNVIDMPYMVPNKTNYNLGDGALTLKL